MATDFTNTPIDIISSTAVSRGVESRLCMIDFSKENLAAGTHTIFELPAGAGLKTGSWWIHTLLAGDSTPTFQFGNGAVMSPPFNVVTAGFGGYYGPNDAVTAQVIGGAASMFDTATNDLELITTNGPYTSGILVFEVNWRDIGNAVTSGYRKGDGTV